ncbi:/ rpmA / 50S ribosomal protein L27 /:343826 Reverse [Candidatus Hepatoplasma crinochetorum]|uniref:Large ribosomal subunit protein bL27 n=1 Tax=Candidatus Hepatoplasma crinochetorum TaxID=295596 RepID=A0A0G7ZN07_9MOLU|nr:/ rpmA / 50S ribosomal protein L27 /:343826 Reverse [Candidatus Hepatoplasma crinochetorum]
MLKLKYKLDLQFFAHKKGAGSSKNGRDSHSQRLGQKLSDGQIAKSGAIIYRQRGTKVHPGLNVKKGKDDTLFAIINGIVKYQRKDNKLIVNVVPITEGGEKKG